MTSPTSDSVPTLHSHVRGGQQPVSGATIQLYAVGSTGDGSSASPLLTTTVTSSDGSGLPNSNANVGNLENSLPAGDFTLTGFFSCPANNPLVYIVATGGNPGLVALTSNSAIAEMAALGNCNNLKASTVINITEVTTVGAVAALSPYMTSYAAVGSGSSDAAALSTAFNTAAEYASITTGQAPGSVPAGYYASSTAVNTLADIVAACINSTGGSYNDGSICGSLFYDAKPASGAKATETIGALLQILENPTNNVTALFGLQGSTPPYLPTLTAAPSNWSLPIVAIPAAPSISPNGGSFNASEAVTLSDTDSNAAIFYTLDGSTPSSTSTLYAGPFALGMTTTVKAIAIDSGAGSPIASAVLTFTGNFPNVTLSPVSVPHGSTAPVTVTASSTANGSTASFSVSGGAGGSFSPSSCVVSNGMCSVSYVPSGSLASGTYAGDMVVNFSAAGSYSATSTSSSLTVSAAVTSASENLQISFTGAGGSYPGQSPAGQLVQGSDGNFYGVTQYGGTHNSGVVYRLSASGVYTVLYNFTGGSDGANPMAGLVEGDDGNFYGTTYAGGINSQGTIFQVTSSGVLTTLYVFTGGATDGANPQAPLMQATAAGGVADGYFYGGTTQGGANGTGMTFRINEVGEYVAGYSFGQANSGVVSVAGLLQFDSGSVQTICLCNTFLPVGLLNSDGSLDSSTESSNGLQAMGELIEAPGHSFYTTTEYGGTANDGTVFQFMVSHPTANFYSFTGGNDGKYPLTALVMGTDGSLYGTASAAGANNGGTAFSITPGGTFTTLYPFGSQATDGTTPSATLLQGADGNFYGSTTNGGSSGYGALYKLVPNVKLPGPVSLTAPSTVAANSAFTLGYSVANAYSDTVKRCFATNTGGDTTVWTGLKTGSPTATNVTLTAPSVAGTYQYTLTCGGTESGFATVHVQ